MPDGTFEPLDRLTVAFRRDLDAPVRQVAHPAIDAFVRGHVGREIPKPHALHTTADQIAAGDPHRRGRNYRSVPLEDVTALAGSTFSGTGRIGSNFCRWSC